MSGRRLLTATTLVALAMSLTTPAGATVDLGGCRSIIHHGMNPDWGEETIYSTEQATRWGFGGEVDARITADKRLGSGHDPNARRVSGGTETRRSSDMTLAEAKAVNLVKGGHSASTAEMVRAAARTTGGRLMITVNGYAEFGEDWRVWGFDALWSVVTNNAMEGRVIVGGFGVIPYLHRISLTCGPSSGKSSTRSGRLSISSIVGWTSSACRPRRSTGSTSMRSAPPGWSSVPE